MKMLLFYLFSLLLCVYESQQYQEYYGNKYKSAKNAEGSHKRIVELMRSYYEEAHARSTYLNPLRFMYEESPYYEMGYITGEIIERYRKVLEHTQRPVRFLGMALYDVLKRVELVQKLYFEIYHLVRMMHETPRKWTSVFEFEDVESFASFDIAADLDEEAGKGPRGRIRKQELNATELYAAQNRLLAQKEALELRRKKILKEYKLLSKIYSDTLVKQNVMRNRTYNRWWPIDYGWEIDYEW